MTDPASAPALPVRPTRLTLAQQALANLLAYVCVKIVADDRATMAMGCMADVIDAARADVPPGFGPMIDAAALVLAAWPARLTRDGAAPWMHAQFRAHCALTDFFFWRGGLALEAWRGASLETPTGASQNAA